MTTEQDRAAGWYDDPFAPGDVARRRWWDGTQWTVGAHWDGTAWSDDTVADGTDAPAAVHGSKRRRVWLWVLLGVLAVGVVGCGVAFVAVARWNSADPDVNHREDLSRAESPTIADQLVDVPGYLYQDVSDSEIQASLDWVRQMEQDAGVPEGEGMVAMSLHSVKADDAAQNTALGSVGTEVGFLQLFELSDAMPSDWGDQPPGNAPGELIDEFDVGEVHVFVFEDAASRDTRFTYTWVRHGVDAAFDGATRDETQRWVEAYLSQPVRVGSEDQALGDAAVPVEGYAYTNTSLREEDVAMFVTGAMGDVPYSYHVISDHQGTIGKLLLVEPAADFDTSTLGTVELDSLNATMPGFTSLGTAEHAGVSVEHLQGPDGDVYVWAHEDLVGIFVTSEHADAAEPFIDAYLSAG